MNRIGNKRGFTLLEIIIVIIIIGVLASLALPRFFKTVEFSRASEALSNLSSIRGAMQRCYVIDNAYTACNVWTALDIEDPNLITTRLFIYTITVGTPTTFTLTATRVPGAPAGTITLNQDGLKTGTGSFESIR